MRAAFGHRLQGMCHAPATLITAGERRSPTRLARNLHALIRGRAVLYLAYEVQSELLSPLRLLVQQLDAALQRQRPQRPVLRKIAAAWEADRSVRLTHSRPAFASIR